MGCHNQHFHTYLRVPVGDGHGLFDMLLGSVGMLILSGGNGSFFFGGLAGGGGGRVFIGDGSSSTMD